MPDRLLAHARAVAGRSHAPYSGSMEGVAVLLADGRWTAAPRIENASFPLTIPALQGAWALTARSGTRPVAVAASRAFTAGERAFLDEIAPHGWTDLAPDVVTAADVVAPPMGAALALTESEPAPTTPQDGLRHALRASTGAVVPASAFPVGAVVVDEGGRWAVGANVEHEADWTRSLCAERVALVAARAAGLDRIRSVYVACAKAPGGTPCGGCRQVLAELAPDADVVVWHGDLPPEQTTPSALLPGAFGSASLGR